MFTSLKTKNGIESILRAQGYEKGVLLSGGPSGDRGRSITNIV